jgi:hypothetical protein
VTRGTAALRAGCPRRRRATAAGEIPHRDDDGEHHERASSTPVKRRTNHRLTPEQMAKPRSSRSRLLRWSQTIAIVVKARQRREASHAYAPPRATRAACIEDRAALDLAPFYTSACGRL